MVQPRTRALLGFGVPMVVLVLLVAAWAIDSGSAGGRVVRNVHLDDRDIGRLPEDSLVTAIGRIAERHLDTPVEIRTTGRTYRSTAGELGLVVDEEATAQAALDVGRTGAAPLRPASWVASFARPLKAPLEFTVRADQLTVALLELEGEEASRVAEPTIVGTPGSVVIKGGVSGFSLDPDDVGRKLVEAAELDEDPITIATDPIEREPTVSDEAARALAADLAAKTARPLEVTAGYTTVELPPATVRSWLRSRPGEDGLEATLNDEKVMADLEATFSEVEGEAVSARFDVVGGQVRLIPAHDGVRCCAADAPAKVLEAVEAGATAVQVPLATIEPELTTAEAEALGIKEPVGAVTTFQGRPQVKSFTTYHACCESRVQNIQRMADLVRGAVISPGDTFSINDFVGERTPEKGFVPAGAIFEGEMVQEVGGGVSQFATTLFNAAFFAGLDFGEYQSHSLVISRYPYGREATIGYPYPDLQIENTTPYGVLIWPTYTPTSITVTLYSTQHVVGEQTGQSQGPMGRCTKVTTVRTRTYAAGTKETDEVFATYRPRESVDC